MASVDDIAAALLAAKQPTAPAMGAIMAARDQLATQPARLGPPDIGEAPIGDGGQLSTGTAWGNRAADIASRVPGHMLGSLASLPQRAINAANADYANRGDYSADRPLYSAGPALEAATLPMGAAAIVGVPMKAGEAVLGAGPVFADKSAARIALNQSSRVIEKYVARDQAYRDGAGPRITPAERAEWLDAFKNKQNAQQWLDSSQPIEIPNE